MAQTGFFLSAANAENKQINVLFISVDDLKPLAGTFGNTLAVTPGIDRLAKEGVVFQNAYCQQAVSGPSRASLMTGLYPDKTRVWDLKTQLRQVNPNVVTLPQYFKTQGYETAALGKIFGKGNVGAGHDVASWTIKYRDPVCDVYAIHKTLNERGKGPSVESADVSDDTYHDGKMTSMAIKLLDSLSTGEKPFFLSVGFLKPHLPFVAPKKYWDMYERNNFKTASFQKKATNGTDLAYHNSEELKGYTDIPDFHSFSDHDSDYLSEAKQKELIHGYYATMSYVDYQISRLLDELKRLKINEKTIVILLSDHGWHLGDHGLWNKHSNFEQATRVPLIISAPGRNKGIIPITFAELTDIFPTLCELANLSLPENLDGVSLVKSIDSPETEIREYAFSQYPRGNDIMGYSIRTKRFRYTIWMKKEFTENIPYESSSVVAREMYDYDNDPLETINIVDDPLYRTDMEKLEKLFAGCMQKQFEAVNEYREYNCLISQQEKSD